MSLNQELTLVPGASKRYISVSKKFVLAHIFAFLWTALSIYLSIPWMKDLAKITTLPVSIFIIGGLAYIPGYFNAILVASLMLDKQPRFKSYFPMEDVTVLIAARNEGTRIEQTLKYIAGQDYRGNIKVLIVDNGSSDDTVRNAKKAGELLNLDVQVMEEKNPGKFNALNTGLRNVTTELVLTLDADTLLNKSAIRYIVARMECAPRNVCAVAGTVLVRNSRDNLITRIQEWDYFLAIASIKRFQGMYQGTLVAQGAYSLYRTSSVIEAGGWPDAIGEDIVLTWNFLKRGWKVYFEPKAIAFTEVPSKFKHLARQRSRWARGMIEALKAVKPWNQPVVYIKYLTGVNLLMPYLDFAYTFFWISGLVLAFFGIYWIVGPMTLFVLPLTFLSYYILYRYQRSVFRELDLKIRKNKLGFIIFVLFYQMVMSPISLFGYAQEFLQLKRVWK